MCFQCMENVLSTVTRINGETIIPAVIDKIKQQLEENNKYIYVTEMEFEIYSYPEGELFNKSILAE